MRTGRKRARVTMRARASADIHNDTEARPQQWRVCQPIRLWRAGSPWSSAPVQHDPHRQRSRVQTRAISHDVRDNLLSLSRFLSDMMRLW